ncbi:apolipoprotein N-acyltransferase [Chlamydia trachomatis]|uniref:apolipoprotein N-acyltransferase n=1 Tax=Chlamydia trachomatis TaxID=813 RepID=UPI0001D6357E|nr:apolipoprotein N-acyltransferase [Chlamydia trachomatis]ADH18241.1 apolipoprotein N-acyltransferase [Chlamydia trachomatis G/9768]ADH20089.1 apolipoprotein N-acyltransferase [Chlamydia trachomatis G/11074]ADH97186.1 apolipoprotein N-acyltransferase [Chlamydia trachomatis G/9301]ROT57154.1 apolipoprotein N-acyltransferase [Chlamydia trachomatis]
MFKLVSYIILSWVLVCLAQPDVSVVASVVSCICGYSLLWAGLFALVEQLSWKKVWCIAFIWTWTVEGAHFSWMLEDLYVGTSIYFVWGILLSYLATLFASFSCLVVWCCRKQYRGALVWLPGVWVAIEAIRYYGLLSGVSFDFIGWPLTATAYGRQFGSFFGWAGQSFLVIAANICCFAACLLKHSFSKGLWLTLCAFPYLLGGAHYEYLKKHFSDSEVLRVAIVQPGYSPHMHAGRTASAIWRGLVSLCQTIQTPVDVIVFPEVSVPFGLHRQAYTLHENQPVLESLLPNKSWGEFFTNLDWIQAIAERYQCTVIMGMERWENKGGILHLYNAAECVSREGEITSYDKRILVPGGEYIPGGKIGFSLCQTFFPEFALSFQRLPGEFSGVVNITERIKAGISICYEETFGYAIRPYKRQQADILVNLTNDGWYPRSRLPLVHFYHGMLRNQELGIPCIRACHTGVSAAVDSLGRIVGILPWESRTCPVSTGVLQVSVPLYSYHTVYARLGDAPLLLIAVCSVIGAIAYFYRKKKETPPQTFF